MRIINLQLLPINYKIVTMLRDILDKVRRQGPARDACR
jgi:hypothetical protein